MNRNVHLFDVVTLGESRARHTGLTITRSFSLLLSILWLVMSVGCASKQMPLLGDASQFDLTLSRHTQDGRITYFTITKTGEFSYSGGQLAIIRDARPVGKLTKAQRDEIWTIVKENKLTEVKSTIFPKGKVVYAFSFNAKGVSGRSIQTTQADAPKLKILHEYLFMILKKARYR